jgi:hypothetical protein
MVLLGLGLVHPLAAQDDEGGDPVRAGQLRRQIEDRFAARVQEELGLTDPQASHMRDVLGRFFLKRRNLEADERRLRQSLAGELRPGVAANKDAVARLTDQLLENKVSYVETYREEVKELRTFLDPVQVAQFLVLRERLFDLLRQAQENGANRRRLRPQSQP